MTQPVSAGTPPPARVDLVLYPGNGDWSQGFEFDDLNGPLDLSGFDLQVHWGRPGPGDVLPPILTSADPTQIQIMPGKVSPNVVIKIPQTVLDTLQFRALTWTFSARAPGAIQAIPWIQGVVTVGGTGR